MGSRARRTVAIAVIAVQVLLILHAYSAPIDTFGFQMFPESSQWQANIYRVLDDGRRIDVRQPWPGGYRWETLVDARGVGDAFSLHHADAGLDATMYLLDAALDRVAANTPDDHETVTLIAEVTLIDNGRSPTTLVLEEQTTLVSRLRSWNAGLDEPINRGPWSHCDWQWDHWVVMHLMPFLTRAADGIISYRDRFWLPYRGGTPDCPATSTSACSGRRWWRDSWCRWGSSPAWRRGGAPVGSPTTSFSARPISTTTAPSSSSS